MSSISADIAAYRKMIAEAKAAREEQGVECAKGDALYQRVIVEGQDADLYRLAGVPSLAPARPLRPACPTHGPSCPGHDTGQGTGSYSSGGTSSAPRPRVTTPKLASDKQLGLIKKLAGERDRFSLVEADRVKVDFVVGGGVPTSKGASELITTLLATVRADKPFQAVVPAAQAAPSTPAVTITDGFYELDGVAYKVQLNQAGDRLYGKKLVDGSWEYVPGVVGVLTRGGAQPLSEALAAQLGALYGSCVLCGRRLTDEESIARGIGPICAEKQGW